jgi:hypothetical protein
MAVSGALWGRGGERRGVWCLVWELTYCRAVTKQASGPIPTCERVALIGAVGARNVRGIPPPSLPSSHANDTGWAVCLFLLATPILKDYQLQQLRSRSPIPHLYRVSLNAILSRPRHLLSHVYFVSSPLLTSSLLSRI